MKKEIPVIEYKRDFSYTELALCFPGGSSLEGDETLGFAHFCEHLAFKLKHGGKSIFEFVSSLGGSSNAYTSHDVITFEISIQSKYVEQVVSFLEQLFSQSFMTISDADFNEERRVVLEEMAMYKDYAADNLHENLMHNMFESHIYGQKILGETETLSHASKEAVADFWKSRVFNSPFLIIAGGYDKKPSIKLDCCDKIENAFLSPWSGQKSFEISHKQNKCYFAAGWKLPPHSGRLEAVLNLISTISYGMDSSIVYNELVYENNVVDSFTDVAEFGVLASSYAQILTMSPSKTEWRLNKWAEIWNKLEFTQAQVSKAREVLLSKEFFASEGVGTLPAAMLKSYLLYREPEKFGRDYFYEFNHLTAEDLNRFKKEYLNFDRVFWGFTKSPRCKFDIGTFNLPKSQDSGEVTTSFSLKNGRNCGFIKQLDRSAFTTGYILKKGGSLMNLPEIPGSYRLTSSALFASAKGMSFDETNAFLDRFGIKIKPVSTKNYSGLKFVCRDVFVEEAVEIIEKFLENEIKRDDFEKEKKNILSELSLMKDYPTYHINKAVLKELFGGTPWEFIEDGIEESIKNMTLEDARKVRGIFMNSNDFVTAFSGAADRTAMEKLLNYLPKSQKVLNPRKWNPKPLSGNTLKIPVKGNDQVYLAKVFRGPRITDSDFDTMKLLESYMSGERSPLFFELREKSGLVYTFMFYTTQTLIGGAVIFVAITSPEKVRAVQDVFDRTVDEIKQGVISEDYLSETKNVLSTAFATAVQYSDFHALNLAEEKIYGIKSGSYLEKGKVRDLIDSTMIVEAANRWLNNGTWILAGAV